MTSIIGLSGYAQSGKDTLAGFLIEEHGFERVAFADALRDMLYALNPLTWAYAPAGVTDRVYDTETVQVIVDKHGWEWAKASSGVRELLQRLGTEAGRQVLGENIWVETALKKVQPGGRYVFTDCRFQNEAEAICTAGGLMVRIERPGCAPVNAHPSETALDGFDFDVYVGNTGTVEDLADRALHLAIRATGRLDPVRVRQVR